MNTYCPSCFHPTVLINEDKNNWKRPYYWQCFQCKLVTTDNLTVNPRLWFQCECGQLENPEKYMKGIITDKCFNCQFWYDVIKEKDKHIIVNRDDGRHAYCPGDETQSGPSQWRGFGGAGFRFVDLRTLQVVTSTNLWHRGRIPDRFYHLLPVTHQGAANAVNQN